MITHLKCAIDLLINAYPLDRCMLLRMFWSDDCLDRRTTQSLNINDNTRRPRRLIRTLEHYCTPTVAGVL